MTILSYISLTIAVFVLAASPGPGVFVTIARAISSGFKPSLFVISGIVLGDIIYLLFAVFGLSAVAKIFGGFFVYLKITASIYLIYVGLKLFFSKPEIPDEIKILKESKKTENFLSGLFVTISNPKAIFFYCGFLPAFADLGDLTFFDIAGIAAIVAVVLGSVMMAYAFLASRARRLLKSEKSVKTLNRSSGGIMVATGTFIAVRS